MPRQNTKAQSNTKALDGTSTTKPVINKILPISTSFIDTIKEGFAFGLGSSIARNVVNSISDPRPNNIIQTTPNCFEYKKCLESDDKYGCFSNLDQKEYVECRTKN
jgi:hypothetical protein